MVATWSAEQDSFEFGRGLSELLGHSPPRGVSVDLAPWQMYQSVLASRTLRITYQSKHWSSSDCELTSIQSYSPRCDCDNQFRLGITNDIPKWTLVFIAWPRYDSSNCQMNFAIRTNITKDIPESAIFSSMCRCNFKAIEMNLIPDIVITKAGQLWKSFTRTI